MSIVTEGMVKVARDAFNACRPVDRGMVCQDFGMQQDEILEQQLEAALTAALQGSVVVPEWQDIGTAPKDGTRINLCWKAGALPAHVELGKRNGRAGWCNTYGHPYSADPDYFQPLPSPPVTRHDGKDGAA